MQKQRSRLPCSLQHVCCLFAALVMLVLAGGCYHFTFQQRPGDAAEPGRVLVTYQERRPTYLNGFVGNGKIDTTRYCENPVRTELRVTAIDVIVSVATLLIYTPHTLYVTCEVPPGQNVASSSR